MSWDNKEMALQKEAVDSEKAQILIKCRITDPNSGHVWIYYVDRENEGFIEWLDGWIK